MIEKPESSLAEVKVLYKVNSGEDLKAEDLFGTERAAKDVEKDSTSRMVRHRVRIYRPQLVAFDFVSLEICNFQNCQQGSNAVFKLSARQ